VSNYGLTPEAQSNVDEIADFIAEESVDAAIRVLEALEDAFQQLAEMPEMEHTREDLTDRPVKFWSVFSYLVVYDPASRPMTVLAVLHGARDVAKLLQNP
jgi:plasmid stabilization system protein ParE